MEPELFAVSNWQDVAAVVGLAGGVLVAIWKVGAFVRGWARRRDEASADELEGRAIEDVSRLGGTPSELKYRLETRRDRRAARVLAERGQARIEGDWVWVNATSYTAELAALSSAWRY